MSAPIDDRPAPPPGSAPEEGTPVNADLEHPLVITVEATGPETVLVLTGELDPHTAPLLQEQIDAVRAPAGTPSPPRWCSSCPASPSSTRRGCAWSSTQKALDAAGGRLVLRRPSETARRLLEITGLVDHIAVEP